MGELAVGPSRREVRSFALFLSVSLCFCLSSALTIYTDGPLLCSQPRKDETLHIFPNVFFAQLHSLRQDARCCFLNDRQLLSVRGFSFPGLVSLIMHCFLPVEQPLPTLYSLLSPDPLIFSRILPQSLRCSRCCDQRPIGRPLLHGAATILAGCTGMELCAGRRSACRGERRSPLCECRAGVVSM